MAAIPPSFVVVNSGVVQCDKGALPSVLTIPPASRIHIESRPVASILDNEFGTHFQPFGTCAMTGTACVPMTPQPWFPGMKGVFLGATPVLTSLCSLACMVGGTIHVIAPGQFSVSNVTSNLTTPTIGEWLTWVGIEQLQRDALRYGDSFPPDYYETMARLLYEVALERTGDYGDALNLLVHLSNHRYGNTFPDRYEALVGTDSTNGWDKLRHFTSAAVLTYRRGSTYASIFGYLKEAQDELQQWVGRDPEGWSPGDLYADNRGEVFGNEIYRRAHPPAPPPPPYPPTGTTSTTTPTPPTMPPTTLPDN